MLPRSSAQQADRGKPSGWIWVFWAVHFLATLGALLALLYLGDEAALYGRDLPVWGDILALVVVALGLPVLYPLLVLEWLRPWSSAAGFPLFLVVAAVNSFLVTLFVRALRGLGARTSKRRDERP